jgi:tetratricopeptide (TPR) repeat protein
LRRNLPVGHYAFASLASERSLNAQAAGRLQSALEFSNQALAIAEAASRAGQQGGHLLGILLWRRSAIELQMGLVESATTDATRALQMMGRTLQPGDFSCNLGYIYLALGRALQAQGKDEKARAALASAAGHFDKTLGPQHVDTRVARELAGL